MQRCSAYAAEFCGLRYWHACTDQPDSERNRINDRAEVDFVSSGEVGKG